MKIGKEHLTPAARMEITSRRALWGSDVYTDDSDVIAACIHAGWIRGEWPEDVDVSMLGLDEGYSVSDVRGLANGHSQNGTKPTASSSSTMTVLTEPPKNGPMPVPESRDLHVTLLILPRLEKYASTTRFGIKSREFGGPIDGDDTHQRSVHDGISFMIIGLRWVTNGGAPQNRLRGKARRERIRKALAEIELAPAWISGPAANANGEREHKMGWWGQGATASAASRSPPSEGDKENANRLENGGGDEENERAEKDESVRAEAQVNGRGQENNGDEAGKCNATEMDVENEKEKDGEGSAEKQPEEAKGEEPKDVPATEVQARASPAKEMSKMNGDTETAQQEGADTNTAQTQQEKVVEA
ncbi:hypothetical protein VTI74DRAFT_302 [Chaetomium olivicolor]